MVFHREILVAQAWPLVLGILAKVVVPAGSFGPKVEVSVLPADDAVVVSVLFPRVG